MASDQNANAQIVYLRIDADSEPNFNPQAQLANLQAVAQAIRTRLLLFQGEWWQNLSDGTPMFQQILGKRASANGLKVMNLALTNRVAGTPYVSSVENPLTTFDPKTRQLNFRCTAQTSFGVVPVTFSPGLAANLG